jgi:hypothetical protein
MRYFSPTNCARLFDSDGLSKLPSLVYISKSALAMMLTVIVKHDVIHENCRRQLSASVREFHDKLSGTEAKGMGDG